MVTKILKTLWKCEHCASIYESKFRCKNCCRDFLKKNNGQKIMTKYVGSLERVKDRQNKGGN